MKTVNSLDFAIELLNTIEVRGKDNLDRLLAVIVALEEVKKGHNEIKVGDTVTFDKKENSK